MPIRLVDGDAIALSSKLREGVKEQWRIHYPYWLTLAEANGTFECNPERIHAKLYAFLLPSVKINDVKTILAQFVKCDLVKTWDQDGKTWGFFVGSDKPGRLIQQSHLKRYKNLPPIYPGLRQDCDRISPDNVRNSPSRIGLDRIGEEGSGASASGAQQPSDSSQPRNEKQEEISVKAKQFVKKCYPIWLSIYGQAATLLIPDNKYGARDQLEMLADTHELPLLLQAFELYAKDQFIWESKADPRILTKFVRSAGEYMAKVQPLNKSTVLDDVAKAASDAAAKEFDEIQASKKPRVQEEQITDISEVI